MLEDPLWYPPENFKLASKIMINLSDHTLKMCVEKTDSGAGAICAFSVAHARQNSFVNCQEIMKCDQYCTYFFLLFDHSYGFS